MVSTQLRILRVFGLTSAEVTAILRQAQADGCTGLRLLERDGEFAVCVQASAPTQAMADEHCDKWAQKLAARFGDAFYATGETSLAQATLNALLKRRRMLVAADETTGRMLGGLLQPLDHSEAAFDFGNSTYADPVKARKIITPPTLLKKFPGDVVQAAAGRAQLAMMVAQADFAAVYMPATVGQAPFVLICDHKGAVACALSPDLNDASIANNILDLVRRRLLGLKLSSGTIQFRPGHEHPLLLVSRAGQSKPGDTARFSLRRRRSNGTRAPFEPMLDFDTVQIPQKDMAAAAAAAVAASMGQPAQKERSETQPAAQPAPVSRPVREDAAQVAASARAAAERALDGAKATRKINRTPGGTIVFDNPALQQQPSAAGTRPDSTGDDTPLDFQTNGAQAAAEYRAARQTAASRRSRPVQDRTDRRRAPGHSILDEDVPDLTTGLDPEAVRAAQKADETSRPGSLEELQSAVEHLYSKDIDSSDESPRPMDAGQSRSLARIDNEERRQRRAIIGLLVALLAVVLAATVGLIVFFSTSLGPLPDSRGYNTAQFDDSAWSYLTNAAGKRDGVMGFLAFPDLDGQLVYQPAATGEQSSDQPQLEGTSYLGSGYPSNTVIAMHNHLLDGLANLGTIQKNAGFTLYLDGTAYRYQMVAVYYHDPAEAGAGAFVLSGQDLSDYGTYLNFVLGIRIRSLYDTGIAMTDRDSFLTLVGDPKQDGARLCITGRLIRDGEDAQLFSSTIQGAASPLQPAVRYTATGQTMPDLTPLLAEQMRWFASASSAEPASAAQQDSDAAASAEGTDAEYSSEELDALMERTDQLASNVSALLEGLTDRAGQAGAIESDLNQGAEGNLPEQQISVEQIVSAVEPASTPTPTPVPTPAADAGQPAPDSAGEATATPQPTPEQPQTSTAEGETINVTMNGTPQTLDLVTCLAMIAQNELGSNAPAEAYKAQCVAAHCWILSQGGYPSVAGATPGDAALSAAREVAHVLVTYNGNVCFTPYFASASTGTASSADVWGGERAWLQAVDSPYDQQVATNWHTTGSESGTARFSRATVQQRILDKLGIDLSGVDPNDWFHIVSANAYGWVSQIQIGPDGGNNTVRTGSWFRETLLAGQSVDGRSLRSQCFTVSYDASLDCFLFDVYGYGHGCGMSQWGAIGYARNGWTYQNILLHYYPGTTLVSY